MRSKDQAEVGAEAGPACQRVKGPTRSFKPGRLASTPGLPSSSQRLIRANGDFAVLRGSSFQRQTAALGQCFEHLLEVHVVFGGGLEECTVVPAHFPDLVPGDGPLVFGQVCFVGADDGGDPRALFGLDLGCFSCHDFCAQCAHFFERVAVVQAEHKQEDVACTREQNEEKGKKERDKLLIRTSKHASDRIYSYFAFCHLHSSNVHTTKCTYTM